MDFLKAFKPELEVESPGRINLIGEHTDYNMGFVLPTAIDKKIVFRIQKNGSQGTCQVFSLDFKKGFAFDLASLKPTANPSDWENYILGVVFELSTRTDKLRGFDCTIESHLPIGSGVSSSAALECGLAFGLSELFGLGIDRKEIALLSRDAEHNFVGTKCGIMDQFASVLSREGHVLLLDCQTLQESYIPFSISPYRLLLLNTNVSHSLATGEYNTRRAECEEGVARIKEKYSAVNSLRDVTTEILSEFKEELRPIVYKRCKYVIEENWRVLQAVEALKTGDLSRLGSLMFASHHGLSNQYEVSCPELDFLANLAERDGRVLGARMMGGGFGGCTINIIHEADTERFIHQAAAAYEEEYKLKLSAFDANPSGGTAFKYI